MQTTRCYGLFHENDPKSGYRDAKRTQMPAKQAVREGLKELKKEIKMWTNEVKDAFEFDPIMAMPLPGRTLSNL